MERYKLEIVNNDGDRYVRGEPAPDGSWMMFKDVEARIAELEAALAIARRDALEEAARRVEMMWLRFREKDEGTSDWIFQKYDDIPTGDDFVAAIRALGGGKMSDDLVERLRTFDIYDYADADKICREAAARIAELEEELSIWHSVFPDIAPERVLPDRRLLLDRIAELEAALWRIVGTLDDPTGGQHVSDMRTASVIAIAALEGGKS